MTRRKEPSPKPPAETPAEAVSLALDEPGTATIDRTEVGADGPAATQAPATGPAPDPAIPRLPDPPAPAGARRAGMLGPLLGGAIAAIGGFALSHFDVLSLRAPDRSADLAALAARLDEAQLRQAAATERANAEVSALASRVSALETAPGPAAPDLSAIEGLEQRLAAIEAAPSGEFAGDAALVARLADLESRLSALPATGASPEIQQQLDAALARLDAAEAEAKARAAEAEVAAESARRVKALGALEAAVDAGGPFADELQALADPALTSALGPRASTGVPTLASLQADFPEAARESLRIARDISADDGWTDRVLDFLAAQTEARPLVPLEGSAPEAILSRAEFAVSEGRVTDALSELAALDPSVLAPFKPWIEAANAQVEAAAALKSARGELRGE